MLVLLQEKNGKYIFSNRTLHIGLSFFVKLANKIAWHLMQKCTFGSSAVPSTGLPKHEQIV